MKNLGFFSREGLKGFGRNGNDLKSICYKMVCVLFRFIKQGSLFEGPGGRVNDLKKCTNNCAWLHRFLCMTVFSRNACHVPFSILFLIKSLTFMKL